MDDNKKQAQQVDEQIEERPDDAAPTGEAEKARLDDIEETGGASEDEWRSALETAVRQRDEYLVMAQRVQADFQNFRRRNAQSREDGYQDGVCEVLGVLLSTLDNLERAIQAADEAGDTSPLCEGVKMTQRQLKDDAARLGLEEVPALGERFDPELHNAVMRVEDGEPGTVLEVFQKGYRIKERMLRYAMVKVAAE